MDVHVGIKAVTGLTLGISLLAACTPGKTEETPKPVTKAPEVSTTPLPKESTFKGKWDGAAADLKITSCGTAEGDQVAKATLKNSAKEARDYQVMIMWLKKDDGKPYGSALVTVKGLKPGESKELELKANVATKTDKCVPNVKAGTLA